MSWENIKQRRNLCLALMSVFIVYAICSSDVIVDGVETENGILFLLSKVASTVWTVNITDIISCFGIYFLLSYGCNEEKRIDLAGVVVSALFSFLYIGCFAYKMTGDAITLFGNTYQSVLTVIRFAGFAGLFYGMYTSIYKWMRKRGRSLVGAEGRGQNSIEQGTSDMSVPGFNWKMFLFSAGIVLAGWLFYIWMAAPGGASGDGITQLGQFCSGNVTSHHPPLSTWIMGFLFTMGRSLTGKAEFGISLYLIFQAIIAALIIGLCVQTLGKMGLKKSGGGTNHAALRLFADGRFFCRLV